LSAGGRNFARRDFHAALLMESLEKQAASKDPNFLVYKEFLAERDEILRYERIESEKAGYDIGFERALLDWTMKYRLLWREYRRRSGLASVPNNRQFDDLPQRLVERSSVHLGG
jgi:hypothetical protein